MGKRRPFVGDRLLTVGEVAATMRVSNMTVYRLIKSGQLAAIRVGKNYRIRALDSHLRSVPVFRNLGQDFLDHLRDRVELVDVAPGQVQADFVQIDDVTAPYDASETESAALVCLTGTSLLVPASGHLPPAPGAPPLAP